MKKTQLLNAALSHAIARLGHGDMLVIGDAGLPVPPGPQFIDLAVTRGVPDFPTVLIAVLSEMQVERAVVAREMRAHSEDVSDRIAACMTDVQIDEVSHEELKALTRNAAAIVRTGECTPYSNILLIAGVVF
jgi:D-ribose pyranase